MTYRGAAVVRSLSFFAKSKVTRRVVSFLADLKLTYSLLCSGGSFLSQTNSATESSEWNVFIRKAAVRSKKELNKVTP